MIPLRMAWRDLPPLPVGVAGAFAGIVGDQLAVAGGSYFDTPPWVGGLKKLTRGIYALRRGEKAWRLAGELPFAIASGASASLAGALYCIGGQTDDGNSSTCIRLVKRGNEIEIQDCARLPVALSMHAAIASRGHLYVAGGQDSVRAARASRGFYRLAVSENGTSCLAPGVLWQSMPELPGPARILPILAGHDEAIYLVGGAELTGDAGPPPSRRFLRDAWCFTEQHGFRRLNDAPRNVQAAPSICLDGRILIFGGNDGAYADQEYVLKDRHPGFSRTILAYSTVGDRWTETGVLPAGLVATPAVCWGHEIVISGGEDRPAHRSTRVLASEWRNL